MVVPARPWRAGADNDTLWQTAGDEEVAGKPPVQKNSGWESLVRMQALCLAGLCLLASVRAAPAGDAAGLYARITDAYMTGKFDDLDAALRQAAARTGDFTAEQKADVSYVRKALAECRPAWWARCKKGRKLRIRQAL